MTFTVSFKVKNCEHLEKVLESLMLVFSSWPTANQLLLGAMGDISENYGRIIFSRTPTIALSPLLVAMEVLVKSLWSIDLEYIKQD